MFKTRRSLSQNFLHDRQLVKKLFGRTSIGKNDTVLEIGPGQGIITQVLAENARQVLAVELDGHLSKSLAAESTHNNIIVFQGDALEFPLPLTPYKVFCNPPFQIEGRLVRKLLNDPNPPEEAHLVVRAKHARRWAGKSYRSQFYVSHAPWFEFSLEYKFAEWDFRPRTQAQAVLLGVRKRKEPLLGWSEREKFTEYVERQFSGEGKRGTRKPTKIKLEEWISRYRKKYDLRQQSLKK